MGYAYPEMYVRMFGPDYRPPAYIEAAYRYARNRLIGRHFRQPAEGLGHDGSPVAHMWRSILDPAKPF